MANALIKRLVHDGDIEVNEALCAAMAAILHRKASEKGRLVSKYIANYSSFSEKRDAITKQLLVKLESC